MRDEVDGEVIGEEEAVEDVREEGGSSMCGLRGGDEGRFSFLFIWLFGGYLVVYWWFIDGFIHMAFHFH